MSEYAIYRLYVDHQVHATKYQLVTFGERLARSEINLNLGLCGFDYFFVGSNVFFFVGLTNFFVGSNDLPGNSIAHQLSNS